MPAGLEAWLKKHGVRLDQLDVFLKRKSRYGQYDTRPIPLRLPHAELQQLTSLSQHGIKLKFTPALQSGLQGTASSSRNMAILPDLVELKLVKCRVSGEADVLQLLGTSGLTSLQKPQRYTAVMLNHTARSCQLRLHWSNAATWWLCTWTFLNAAPRRILKRLGPLH